MIFAYNLISWSLSLLILLLDIRLLVVILQMKEAKMLFGLLTFLVINDCLGTSVLFWHDIPSFIFGYSIIRNGLLIFFSKNFPSLYFICSGCSLTIASIFLRPSNVADIFDGQLCCCPISLLVQSQSSQTDCSHRHFSLYCHFVYDRLISFLYYAYMCQPAGRPGRKR